ncbi:hypothetical protein ACFLU6_00285 [Acidobacteriota bacterium]
MAQKLRGIEAAAEALIRSGANLFCLPLSPVLTDLEEYLTCRAADGYGGEIFTVPSDEEAIQVIFGAAAGSALAVTATEGAGFQRMLEGLGHLAAAELPGIILAVMTGGPGIGSTFPSQHLYRLSTTGGGLPVPVFAPGSVQEMAEQASVAAELSASLKTPVVLLVDSALARITDTVDLEKAGIQNVGEALQEQSRIRVITAYTNRSDGLDRDRRVTGKLEQMRTINPFVSVGDSDPDVLLIGFGSIARAAEASLPLIGNAGFSARLMRLRVLSPFPEGAVASEVESAKSTLVVELNTGQMVNDVRACAGKSSIDGIALPSQDIPLPEELAKLILEAMGR